MGPSVPKQQNQIHKMSNMVNHYMTPRLRVSLRHALNNNPPVDFICKLFGFVSFYNDVAFTICRNFEVLVRKSRTECKFRAIW